MRGYQPSLWTRHGDTTDAVNHYPALTTAPTTSAHGIAIPPDHRDVLASLALTHVAVGARTATIIIWAYKPATQIMVSGAWSPVTAGAGFGAQWVNIGELQIDEASDGAECHLLEAIAGFTRLAIQVAASTGTPTIYADFGFSAHRSAGRGE